MKQSIRFLLNDTSSELSLPPASTVLDVLRKHIGLPGTKEGCREGECGACTVLVGELRKSGLTYRAVPSCLLPAGELGGKHLVTIEGLAPGLTPIQQAFVDEGASQCGFCTPGFIMSLTGYFLSGGPLTMDGALISIDGNICRCTGYAPIRRAIGSVLERCGLENKSPGLESLVRLNILPSYFTGIKAKLQALRESGGRRDSPGAVGDAGMPSGEAPVILAGGTDMYIQRGDELSERKISFISAIEGVGNIEDSRDAVLVGAGVTVEDFRKNGLLNGLFPGLEDKMLLVASTILRNRATLGGNIVNASPIADMAVLLLAMDSRISLSGPSGLRTVQLKNFFLSYKRLDLRDGEMVKSFEIPKPAGGALWNFEKVSRRRRLDIAACNSAVTLSMDGDRMKNVCLSCGGVAPVPLAALKTSEYLTGKKVNSETIRNAAGILVGELSPISDVRGTADYKKELAVRQLYAHFLHFFPERISFPENGGNS